VKVALCQFNPTVGALQNNARRLLDHAHETVSAGAELFLAPELALCGYPPKDLMGNADFQSACEDALDLLAKEAPLAMIVGAPHYSSLRAKRSNPGFVDCHGAIAPRNDDMGFNAAVYCFESTTQVIARKQLLPNYQVFDDKRYFSSGGYLPPFEKGGQGGFSFGITICEDAWNDAQFWQTRRYEIDPVNELVARDNPDILVTIMASPFETGKSAIREAMFSHMAKRYSKPYLVVGQVGANDGLIFDGGSMVIDAQGQVMQRATDFQEDLIICEL
jgi:predicted amidohydrolase